MIFYPQKTKLIEDTKLYLPFAIIKLDFKLTKIVFPLR